MKSLILKAEIVPDTFSPSILQHLSSFTFIELNVDRYVKLIYQYWFYCLFYFIACHIIAHHIKTYLYLIYYEIVVIVFTNI